MQERILSCSIFDEDCRIRRRELLLRWVVVRVVGRVGLVGRSYGTLPWGAGEEKEKAPT